MMKRPLLTLLICLYLMPMVIPGQTKRDPRSVGLAGAYGTVADGIFAVGYNPALIAFQQDKPFMMQLVGFDLGMVSNYVSVANLNAISGDTLTQGDKDLLLRKLDRAGGLRLFSDINLPLPVLNFASGNMALTSNMVLLGDVVIPTGLLSLLLNGNPVSEEIDMTLKLDLLGVNEYGFSFAIPSNDFAWGVTLKYLQGLFYFGIDQDSSNAFMMTDTTAVYGKGSYFLRQGIGGSGLGLDIGFATREFDGWRLGVSLVNAAGRIHWNKSGVIKDMLAGSDEVYGNEDDLFHLSWGGIALNDSMAVRYNYFIDTLNAATMSNDSIFYSNPSEEQVVYNLDSNGKLKQFSTRYPAIFRISVSKRFKDLLVVSDLSAGFENRFFARNRWRWSIGAEFNRNPSFPVRLGYSWAGHDRKELGMGIGIHKGPVIFDFGLGLRNGIWIHSMKGLNLSMGITLTGFGSRKEKAPEPEPLPIG